MTKEFTDREKFIFISGSLMGLRMRFPEARESINELMRMTGLDKIEEYYKAGRLESPTFFPVIEAID